MTTGANTRTHVVRQAPVRSHRLPEAARVAHVGSHVRVTEAGVDGRSRLVLHQRCRILQVDPAHTVATDATTSGQARACEADATDSTGALHTAQPALSAGHTRKHSRKPRVHSATHVESSAEPALDSAAPATAGRVPVTSRTPVSRATFSNTSALAPGFRSARRARCSAVLRSGCGTCSAARLRAVPEAPPCSVWRYFMYLPVGVARRPGVNAASRFCGGGWVGKGGRSFAAAADSAPPRTPGRQPIARRRAWQGGSGNVNITGDHSPRTPAAPALPRVCCSSFLRSGALDPYLAAFHVTSRGAGVPAQRRPVVLYHRLLAMHTRQASNQPARADQQDCHTNPRTHADPKRRWWWIC